MDGDPAPPDRSTTCWRSRRDARTAHRLRRTRSERQADAGRAAARSLDRCRPRVRLLSFPDYGTPIGEEIERALRGARDYGARCHAAALRGQSYEWRPEIERRAQRRRDSDLRPVSHRASRMARRRDSIRRGCWRFSGTCRSPTSRSCSTSRLRCLQTQDRRPRSLRTGSRAARSGAGTAIFGWQARRLGASQRGSRSSSRGRRCLGGCRKTSVGRGLLSRPACPPGQKAGPGLRRPFKHRVGCPTFRAESRKFHVVRPSSLSGSSR